MAKKMTKSDSLTLAIQNAKLLLESDDMTAEQRAKLEEAIGVYANMKVKLDTPRPVSAATAAKNVERNEKRKAETAAARVELAAQVVPGLRKHLANDITVMELTKVGIENGDLPADFTWHKTITFLKREMADEVVKTERKKGGDLYRLR